MIGSPAAEVLQDTTAPFNTIKATADFLASKLSHVNPSSLVHCSTCPKLTLRRNTPSGEKIWIAHAFKEGLNIHWSKWGTRGRQKVISINQCAGNSSVLEMQKRTIEKLKKGYEVLLHESRFP